jgi:hypothetical protein
MTLDAAGLQRAEVVGARDVAVQAGRVELREHEHPRQAAVDAVAQRDVDQPHSPRDRHGGLARSRL